MTDKLIKRFGTAQQGSALIMTIVLTVLLAIVAVMFLTVARMDRASTSNIADNKTLDSAAKSLIEIINKELINDTPGVAGQEYYDYPDAENPWLASIEPYLADANDIAEPNDDIYRWRQISDVTGYLKNRSFIVRDVNVDPEYPLGRPTQDVIREYPTITLAGDVLQEQLADADGDGIADSKWFELEDPDWSMRSSKGQRIYAAVRVIDNGAMANINTAHSFNPATADGSSQMQVNLKGLLKGTTAQITTQMTDFNEARCGGGSGYWPNYEKNVIWDYNSVPSGGYLPFDISDELELRYRYCIDSKFVARIESVIPETLYGAGIPNSSNLYDTSTQAGQSANPCASNWRLIDWQRRLTEPDDCKADRRHMLTTVNYDRIITPAGGKMTNINTADANSLYTAVRAGLIDVNSSFPDANKISAQIAVNIRDYYDSDSNVAVLRVDDVNYYGFERPCVYISELACRVGTDVNDPNRSYAIELFKPYFEDSDPCSSWDVIIDGDPPISIANWSGTNSQYYVIRWHNTFVPLDINVGTPYQDIDNSSNTIIFDANSKISLTRDVNGVSVVVDSVAVPAGWSPAPSPVADGNHCVQRDITKHRCIKRLWNLTDSNAVTLGRPNGYDSGDANYIQAHPADVNFTNVGEIGMIFCKSAYYKFGEPNTNAVGYGTNKTESQVRLDLSEPDYQHIFKYLTVWPPSYVSDPNETRIKGRININTAPAFVIAQLPWVSRDVNDPNLAKEIVAYRDSNDVKGFKSIGELMNVSGIDYYVTDGNDQEGYPDLTTKSPTDGDGAANDFEERDLIFARISDLVTVRSDVFTAYILVRVGIDGPQKRYMVILDRSQTTKDNRKVKTRAFQSVPEAR
ncbi:MAG: helix-hairpin-helix domain-containing protein [Phycisphaerae bacterium]|nr:helix-hairpin-helix domain-containing protein [Phycisphaerae bacterium]